MPIGERGAGGMWKELAVLCAPSSSLSYPYCRPCSNGPGADFLVRKSGDFDNGKAKAQLP